MKGKLYVTATPIGNLSEMSPRAIETLKSVDFILCEDTTHSKKLLRHFEISTPIKSYHKFSEAKSIPDIINQLNAGRDIVITAAYTISDPGARPLRFTKIISSARNKRKARNQHLRA